MTYRPNLRKPAAGAIARPRETFAFKSGTCACGKGVKVGEPMFYDGASDTNSCTGCCNIGKSSLMVAEPESTAAQVVLDRIKMIENLPKPLSANLFDELEDLKSRFDVSSLKRRVVDPSLYPQSGLQCGWLLMKAARIGICGRCKDATPVGTQIAWNNKSYKVMCRKCIGS